MAQPVFAILILTSGFHEGATVRDTRLANELHRRGYKVVIYWMMERNPRLLASAIPQRMLVSGLRYLRPRASGFWDWWGRITNLMPERSRRRAARAFPRLVPRLLRNFLAEMCAENPDPPIVDRLEKFMAADGVTHLLPTFAATCPLALAAKSRGRHRFDYLVTFQGEEIIANFVEPRRNLGQYYQLLQHCLTASPWKGIAVSEDYVRRLQGEMGIDPNRLTVIHPGIDLPQAQERAPPFEILTAAFPGLQPDVPIVAYLGRQDPEKGIDLLLYAARILRERGVKHQLVICGGFSFGRRYFDVCRQIARHLRLSVFWQLQVSDELRMALFSHSRCTVCPSIHGEPFGMVVAEAMALGTPVLVPDRGGIAELIRAGDAVGGLTFRTWDSRDLAAQLERLLTNDALHAALAEKAHEVAARFGIQAMADNLLAHLGLPMGPKSTAAPSILANK